MIRLGKSTAKESADIDLVPDTEPVFESLPENVEQRDASDAWHLARTGALALAKGSGGLGFLAARGAAKGGLLLAKKGAARARASRDDIATITSADKQRVASLPKVQRPRVKFVVGTVALAALVGSAVFFRKNSRSQPPQVAPAPPTLGNPTTNGQTNGASASEPRHALREPGPVTKPSSVTEPGPVTKPKPGPVTKPSN